MSEKWADEYRRMESKRRHPSYDPGKEVFDLMSHRLSDLRNEFEGLNEIAQQTKGISGWWFRRSVKKTLKLIYEMEIQMREHGLTITPISTNFRERCPHLVWLEDCTMPTCLEIKAGRHYRAQKEARRLSRAGKLKGDRP